MNKRILLSVLTIGAVLAMVGGATTAYFSDTETSKDNTFTAGTIDIAVDDQNPWERDNFYTLDDMKPSYTDYIDFVIYNEGTNPANVWKILKDFDTDSGKTSEPECLAEGGSWTANNNGGDGYCTGNNQERHDIDNRIYYDLRVELYNVDPGTVDDPNNVEPVWWETIYMDEDEVTAGSLEGDKMYLGMIPAGWWMKVEQSYHMPDWVGNKFQGDTLDFGIELYAEQLTNTVRMVRKNDADSLEPHHIWDGDYAEFTYKVMDRELAWELTTSGVDDGDYTLLVWDDSDDGYVWDWDNDRSSAIVLAHIDDSGATYTDIGSIDLNSNLTNAKLWLVPGTHGTLGGSAGDFGWSETTTYFETGLMDYYDADL